MTGDHCSCCNDCHCIIAVVEIVTHRGGTAHLSASELRVKHANTKFKSSQARIRKLVKKIGYPLYLTTGENNKSGSIGSRNLLSLKKKMKITLKCTEPEKFESDPFTFAGTTTRGRSSIITIATTTTK
ncbi:hypothetical protein E2C01_006906 [Portunus trituberculatus]|uniref:Uncharacterized protein n=1 Tax=Portunus trituberculatus TaxID=210409 RepID=A0A5B7CXJ4_PORTR|nr:hypothetical protein [Portunus trituberculatus]